MFDCRSILSVLRAESVRAEHAGSHGWCRLVQGARASRYRTITIRLLGDFYDDMMMMMCALTMGK